MRISSSALVAALGLILLAGPALAQGEPKKKSDEFKKRPEATEKDSGEDPLIYGKPLSHWVKDIRNNDPGVREHAMQTVGDWAIRNEKNLALARRKAGRAVISELADWDPSLRANAAIALGQLGMEGEEIGTGLKAMGRLLNDTQAVVRFRAAMVLGGFGPPAKDTIPQLVFALQDHNSSWEVRKACAFALGKVSGDPKDGPSPRAIRGLTDTLKDSCAQVRLECCVALAGLGRAKSNDVREWERKALYSAARDREKTVCIWAYMALLRMEEKVSKPYLRSITAYLKDDDAEVRLHAVRALAALGPEAKPSMPDLIDALRDTEPTVVLAVIGLLGSMGETAKLAVPDLERLSSHKNEIIKQTAQDAIKYLTSKDKKTVPTDAKLKAPEAPK